MVESSMKIFGIGIFENLLDAKFEKKLLLGSGISVYNSNSKN